MTFAKRLQDLRKQSGITQPELAKAIDGSDRTIGAWERGIAMPNSETIIKLADYFNVSTDYLLCREIPIKDNNVDIDPSFKSLQRCYESLPLVDKQKMIKMYAVMFGEAFNEDSKDGKQ